MIEIKPMMKSYKFRGVNGNSLVLSETPDRQEIAVSIPDAMISQDAVVLLTAEQFGLLCRLDSHYDGLECKPGQAELELVEEPSAVIDAEFDEVPRAE